jgi:hypothetical protein
MESLEAYLDRKSEELTLLNSFLDTPLKLRPPLSAAGVIEQKFHLAAALKAQHALHDWAHTETAWTHRGRGHAGPFEFSYDYQRADLEVTGPSFYRFDGHANTRTIYTSSGMASISALLLAVVRLVSQADVVVLPGSYGETLELIENHFSQLHLVRVDGPPGQLISAPPQRPRILVFDSCISGAAYEAILACENPRLDLVMFDTTCFSSGSGRVRRVLSWAHRCDIPIALVRSHTKLDSLGIEYGRLGSTVFVGWDRFGRGRHQALVDLPDEMRNAVRLFGGAALPAHFPPFVGAEAYRTLTARRIAAILRNGRRIARSLAGSLVSTAVSHFSHGLYVTLAPQQMLDQNQTRQVVEDLCRDLRGAGLPLRHAGSFGFDFGAAEWFHDTSCDRYAVRIAVPDLPTQLWDQVAKAVAEWWSAHAAD